MVQQCLRGILILALRGQGYSRPFFSIDHCPNFASFFFPSFGLPPFCVPRSGSSHHHSPSCPTYTYSIKTLPFFSPQLLSYPVSLPSPTLTASSFPFPIGSSPPPHTFSLFPVVVHEPFDNFSSSVLNSACVQTPQKIDLSTIFFFSLSFFRCSLSPYCSDSLGSPLPASTTCAISESVACVMRHHAFLRFLCRSRSPATHYKLATTTTRTLSLQSTASCRSAKESKLQSRERVLLG